MRSKRAAAALAGVLEKKVVRSLDQNGIQGFTECVRGVAECVQGVTKCMQGVAECVRGVTECVQGVTECVQEVPGRVQACRTAGLSEMSAMAPV